MSNGVILCWVLKRFHASLNYSAGYGMSLRLTGVATDRHTACTDKLRALARHDLSRRIHEEAEGFLSYRIADRRGDHSDHRGDCDSELDAREDVGERVFRRWLTAHD